MPGRYHGQGGRHGHGGGGRGAQPRRIRRFIEPALLLSLQGSPTHGYGLVESLKAMGLEEYPADLSAIYRILYDLEAQGMLVSRQESERTAGPPRRVYELTEEGRAYLQEWVADLEATDRVLHRFLWAYDRETQAGDGEDSE
jgi:PadR family transcriptional regulator PadR